MKRSSPVSVSVFEVLERRALMSAVPVTNTNDSGAGSLRDAISIAVSGDTIDLSQVTGTITLASTIDIDKALTLTGSGQSNLTISGGGSTQLFTVEHDNAVTFSDLTLDSGHASFGGAFQMSGTYGAWGASLLTLDRVTLSNNQATASGGAIWMQNATLAMTDCTVVDNSVTNTQGSASAGAIATGNGSFTLTGCTFDNNSAIATADDMFNSGTDQGMASGGAIVSQSLDSASITNCTFVNNHAEVLSGSNTTSNAQTEGGAMLIIVNNAFTMTNCTLTGNTVVNDPHSTTLGKGGAIDILDLGNSTSSFVTTNTIIAGNTAASGADAFVSTTTITADHDLIGDGTSTGITGGVNGNLVGTTASPIISNLGTLSDNGGDTFTIPLLAGSPAIDAGTDAGVPTADQRGQTRVGTTDIGAFEYTLPVAPPVQLVDGQLLVDGTVGDDVIQVWSPSAQPDMLRVIRNGRTWNFSDTGITFVQVTGDAGDDTITVNTGVASTLVDGGDGNDTIIGSDGSENLLGGAGDDSINGGGGTDRLYGGDGTDTITAGIGTATLYGDAGDDVLYARNGTRDHLFGNAGDNDSAQVDNKDILADIAVLLA